MGGRDLLGQAFSPWSSGQHPEHGGCSTDREEERNRRVKAPWVEGCSPCSGHPDTGAGMNVLGWVGRDCMSPALGKPGCSLPTWGGRPVSTAGLTRVSVASLLLSALRCPEEEAKGLLGWDVCLGAQPRRRQKSGVWAPGPVGGSVLSSSRWTSRRGARGLGARLGCKLPPLPVAVLLSSTPACPVQLGGRRRPRRTPGPASSARRSGTRGCELGSDLDSGSQADRGRQRLPAWIEDWPCGLFL